MSAHASENLLDDEKWLDGGLGSKAGTYDCRYDELESEEGSRTLWARIWEKSKDAFIFTLMLALYCLVVLAFGYCLVHIEASRSVPITREVMLAEMRKQSEELQKIVASVQEANLRLGRLEEATRKVCTGVSQSMSDSLTVQNAGY
ncbi:hypothetical protein B0H16DRAFT_1711601 [Mycena metata]|uniref:Uncharacterized protein n=1 Tax=Mycena metata TaxID=1033252 RepID=A0AAD7K6C0_9AGAR|nr:hypothetical protein B0H16DRAFT_1711601 [Mycena metata]